MATEHLSGYKRWLLYFIKHIWLYEPEITIPLRHGAEEGSPYTCQGVVLIPVLELCVKEPGIYFSSPFLAS